MLLLLLLYILSNDTNHILNCIYIVVLAIHVINKPGDEVEMLQYSRGDIVVAIESCQLKQILIIAHFLIESRSLVCVLIVIRNLYNGRICRLQKGSKTSFYAYIYGCFLYTLASAILLTHSLPHSVDITLPNTLLRHSFFDRLN